MNVVDLLNGAEAVDSGLFGEELGILAGDVESPAYKVLAEIIAAYPLIFDYRPKPTCCLQALALVGRAIDEMHEEAGRRVV